MDELNIDRLTTLFASPSISEGIERACQSDAGARFYRAALQVNPFGYLDRHAKKTSYKDEGEYNAAFVEACHENNIEIVAVTDHFRFDTSESLITALGEAGIHAFPGFEANSSEGIHLLCLFEQGEDTSKMNRHIGDCGVTDLTDESPQSEKTAEQIAELVSKRGGLTIAAHATSANGLLEVLSGNSRARCWKSKNIYAAAIAGSPDGVQDKFRNIIRNKDQAAKRHRPMAIINANDVDDPEELSNRSATTFIKMSDVTIEGLRQAFLDFDSRIQLNSEVEEKPHTEIIAISWEGGLLDGQAVRLNSGLNVLVGGRGSGKSTVIESIRYALDLKPRGDEAARSHKSILKDVIRPGTEINILIHSPYPSPQYYLITRIYGKDAHVFNESGDLLDDLCPLDVMGDIEIYGQHEISELTRKKGEIAEILRRFIVTDDDDEQDSDTILELRTNSDSIVSQRNKIEQLDEALSVLPELREKLKRFKAAKLDEKLKSKTQIDEEAAVFEGIEEQINDLEARAKALCPEELYEGLLEEDFEDSALNPDVLKELDGVHDRIIAASERAKKYLAAIAKYCSAEVQQIEKTWLSSKNDVEKGYNAALKELSKKGIDGSAYISVRDQIKKLAPKERQLRLAESELKKLEKKRKTLLAKFESEAAEDLRRLERAAKRVGKKLRGKVRVEIQNSRDLASLEDLIGEYVSGQFNQAMSKLAEISDLNLSDLADAIRSGVPALQRKFGIAKGSAEKFVEAGEELALALEQHRLRPEAMLSLNVGTPENENWKSIEQLSTGQKATAVLLLLLLEADAPLIIDQPEDDLDNRFIVGSVVSAIKKEKKSRQFLFSSHNANIPVLGDAEQIIGLSPVIDAGIETSEIREELCGSIDTPTVKDLIKELLEGGQEAFEFRREKYGF